MEKMDRHRGHFYNWYDTQSLKTLPPHYISTVDSGNLCGYLLTLKWGLLELPDRKISGDRLPEGIADTYRVLKDVAENTSKNELAEFKKHLDTPVVLKGTTVNELWRRLDLLTQSASDHCRNL